jgi:hypothetical protein
MTRTALYRFYDTGGTLLYVGVSVRPWTRWKEHRGEKDWAEEVATSTMEWFDSRPEALAAEKDAIIAEEPIHNVVHNRGRRADAPLIDVICWACDLPIDDGDGWIECDAGLADERLNARRRIEDAGGPLAVMDVRELIDNPIWQQVPWAAWHRSCDPAPDVEGYVIEVEKMRTLSDLFDWCGHLGEKRWVAATSWTDLVRGVKTGNGTLRMEASVLGVLH